MRSREKGFERQDEWYKVLIGKGEELLPELLTPRCEILHTVRWLESFCAPRGGGGGGGGHLSSPAAGVYRPPVRSPRRITGDGDPVCRPPQPAALSVWAERFKEMGYWRTASSLCFFDLCFLFCLFFKKGTPVIGRVVYFVKVFCEVGVSVVFHNHQPKCTREQY